MRFPGLLTCTAILGLFFSNSAPAGMEIIGHRGARLLAPDNTLASTRLAYELGADIAECDVRITSDGIPVLMHDREMKQTTGQPGFIDGYTLAQLKTFECGAWFGPAWAGEPIPTLAEMLAVAKQYNRKLLLDIKGEYIAGQVVKVIKDSGIPLRQVLILTWWASMTTEYTTRLPGGEFLRNPARLSDGNGIPPEITTSVELADMRRLGVTTLSFFYNKITPEDIRRFHAAGFKVSLFNAPSESAFYYEDVGLDQFWTDYLRVSIPGLRKKSQQWNSWADSMHLPADQRHTRQDPDGDGRDNLTEYALGSDPLAADPPLAPGMDFAVPGSSARSPVPSGFDWTVNLRKNWSEFLTVTPQTSTSTSAWTNLPLNATIFTALSPVQVMFKFPVAASGKQFYRLRFDVKQ